MEKQRENKRRQEDNMDGRETRRKGPKERGGCLDQAFSCTAGG